TTGGLTPDQMARTLESVFGDRATRAGAALEDFGMLQPALIQNVPDEVSVHPEVTLIRDRAGLREWAADITEGWDGQDDRVDAALRAMRDELAETPQTGPAPSETPRTVVPAPGEPGWVPRSRSEVRGVDDVVRFVDQLDVDSPWDQVAARGLYGQYGDAVDERLRARFTKLNFVDPYEMKKAADADGQAAEFESEATVEPTVVAQEADLTLSDEALGDADTARQRAVQATQWRQQQARRTSNRGPVQRR
ncbi:hypothetical protein, partial [Amycolatopsis sp. NPDC051903]|uniref:hypothetical protein n=1 Tax=Amycolatopsis sp. NPDC051903 TaxID=3363936 RepID=UPI0037B61A22